MLEDQLYDVYARVIFMLLVGLFLLGRKEGVGLACVFVRLHLSFIALAALGLKRFGSGVVGSRNMVQPLTAVLLVTTVIHLIMDMDRPRSGLVTVTRQGMVDLRNRLPALPPQAP